MLSLRLSEPYWNNYRRWRFGPFYGNTLNVYHSRPSWSFGISLFRATRFGVFAEIEASKWFGWHLIAGWWYKYGWFTLIKPWAEWPSWH